LKNFAIELKPILKKNGLLFSPLATRASRLTVKKVRVDEISETKIRERIQKRPQIILVRGSNLD